MSVDGRGEVHIIEREGRVCSEERGWDRCRERERAIDEERWGKI
jgi:hypothetical protein